MLSTVTLDKLRSDSDAYGKIEGALVSSLVDTSKAAIAGLMPGDIIIGVNQHPTPTPQMAVELAQRQKEFLLLSIFRDGRKLFLVVK